MIGGRNRFLLLALGVLLVGCGDRQPATSVVGTWHLTAKNDNSSSANRDQSWTTYKADGTFVRKLVIHGNEMLDTGKYWIKDGTLYLKTLTSTEPGVVQEGEEFDGEGKIWFEGKILVFGGGDAEDWLYLEPVESIPQTGAE